MEYSVKFGNGDPLRSMQHMLDLDDEFPTVDMFGSQCHSAQVGPGWTAILRPVLIALAENDCKAAQIKQKLGGLRVYWNYPDALEKALSLWQCSGRHVEAPDAEQRAKLRGIIEPIINLAEELSFHTCEVCGEEARLNSDQGYYLTICLLCKDQRG